MRRSPEVSKVIMGTTHVTVTVRNPADPDKFWEGLFLVDTGAFDSLIPGSILRQLGFIPKGKRKYELADGTELEMDVTTGDLEFMGEISADVIIFGPDGAEPILGVTALESAAVMVDPRTRELKKLPASPLK